MHLHVFTCMFQEEHAVLNVTHIVTIEILILEPIIKIKLII